MVEEQLVSEQVKCTEVIKTKTDVLEEKIRVLKQ